MEKIQLKAGSFPYFFQSFYYESLNIMVRLAIADDHALMREAYTLFLTRDPRISVVASCKNGGEAILACRQLRPDVILMDINMTPTNGIEATKAIRLFSSEIKILGISTHTDKSYMTALMRAGANGYVTKNSSAEEMKKAIFLVLEGKEYLCEEIKNIL